MKHAADYHGRTAYHRNTMSSSGLDWSSRPELYKTWPDIRPLPLPRDLSLPKADGASALKGELTRAPVPLSLEALAGLMFLSYGFTDQVEYGAEVFQYRGVPSAGALYPTEVYLAARGIEGLEDGLYHYAIQDFSLTPLRKGAPPSWLPAPTLIFTGIFFRSAWKYKDRAYRYCLIDTGHVVENVLTTAPCLGIPARMEADFNDTRVNEYLGLDPVKETAFALVPLGESPAGGADEGGPEALEKIGKARAVARNEAVFGLITEISRLTSAPLTGPLPGAGSGELKGGTELEAAWRGFDGPTIVQAIQKRRSRRNFKPKSVTKNELAQTLEMLRLDDLGGIVETGFLTNEVLDIVDGFHWTGAGNQISLHRKGFMGPNLARAALGQDWLGRANMIFVVSADLTRLEEAIGPRALRLAYMAAGRLGQRAYLAAEIMGWGCCGVGAFFDAEVVELLGLPDRLSPLYILPMGPVKKRTHGGRPTIM